MDFVVATQEILDKSPHQLQIIELMTKVENWLLLNQIQQTDLQQTVLVNHLNEMIKRAKSGEKIPVVDETMFSEISTKAMELAKEIVTSVGNLTIDEQLVLSIHFESAGFN